MLNLTLDDLLNFFKEKELKVEFQQETNQLLTVFDIDEKQYPVFIKIYEDSHLVQLLAFLPCPVEKHLVSDMARLLHLLNKELDLPGFGMDEMESMVFFRIMIPSLNKKISKEMLLAMMKSLENVCTVFAPIVEAVAFELTTLNQILEKAQEPQ